MLTAQVSALLSLHLSQEGVLLLTILCIYRIPPKNDEQIRILPTPLPHRGLNDMNLAMHW